jgi:hypothetical protein
LLARRAGVLVAHLVGAALGCAAGAAGAQQLMDINVSGAIEESRAFTTRYTSTPGAATPWQINGSLVVVYRLTGPATDVTVDATLLANTTPRLASGSGSLQTIALTTVFITNVLDEEQGPPTQALKVSHTFPNNGIVKRQVLRVSAGPFPAVCGTSGGCSKVDVYVVIIMDPQPHVAILGGPLFPVVLGPPVPTFLQLSMFGVNPFTDVSDVAIDGSSLRRIDSGVVPLNQSPGANNWDRIPQDPLLPGDVEYPGSDSKTVEKFLGCGGGGCSPFGVRIGMPESFGPGLHHLRVSGIPYQAIIYSLFYQPAPVGFSGNASLNIDQEFIVLDPKLQVSPGQAEAGATITVSGTGFAPDNEIPLRMSVNCCGGVVPIGSARTSLSGFFSTQVALPQVNAPPFTSVWSSSAPPGATAPGLILADIGDAAFVTKNKIVGSKSVPIVFVKPGGTPATSTTTTLPPQTCTSAAECDDGDRCTQDTCPAGVCVHTRLVGAAGIQCTLPVSGIRPPLCTNDSMPPRTEKQYGKATGLIDRAIKRTGGAVKRLLKKADKALKKAEAAVRIANGVGKLSDDCADGLVDLIDDVRGRIKLALNGG